MIGVGVGAQCERFVELIYGTQELRRLLVLCVLVATVTIFGFANAGSLKVGTEGAFPPFNYVDSGGNVRGFDVEIAAALCEKINSYCEVITNDWDGMIPALNEGGFDFVVASMLITPEFQR